MALTVSLVPFWLSRAEYQDRFLLPLASLWLAWRARDRFRRLPAAPSLSGLPLVALAALLFPVGWYVHALTGARTVLLWWLAAGLLAAAVGLLVCQFGWRHVRLLAFPLLFWLLALPAPARLRGPAQGLLKELATRLALGGLSLLHIPAQRSGFILSLPSGDLGVADACSGIRSLTALFAVALLMAYWRGLSVFRSACFLALAVPVVIASNALRIVVTALLQESFGTSAIEGTAHEVLGTLAVLVSLACVAGLGLLFAKAPAPTPPADEEMPVRAGRGGVPAAVLLTLALVACVWAETRRSEFHESVRLDAVATRLGDWVGEDVEAPPKVYEMLTYDQAIHRIYRNPVGQEVHVWVLFWSSAAHTMGTAESHHPDICWPRQGWEIRQRAGKELRVPGLAGHVPASVRYYQRGAAQQLLLYWTQYGSRFSRDEPEHVRTGGKEHGWIAELLAGPTGAGQSGRLSVLIGAEVWGSPEYSEHVLVGFCREFLADLYTVCPWARPQP